MMRKFLTGLALLAASPTLAEDLPGSSFTFGLWRGGAATDAAGNYSHCYATLSYTQGDQIWVNVTWDEVVEVILSFPGLKLKQGQELDASLMMESGSPTAGTAVAVDETHVSFRMSPVNDSHVYLSQGRWLRLVGVGHDEAYDVSGLGGALGLVRQCHEMHKG